MTNHPTIPGQLPESSWTDTRCFSTALRRADRVLTRLYDDALRPLNLTVNQYSLLSLIRVAPEFTTLTDLAEAQAMDRTTLTRALAPLVRRGYVTLQSATDRRIKTVRLTAEGQAILDLARPLWRSVQNRIAGQQQLLHMEKLVTELAQLVNTVRH